MGRFFIDRPVFAWVIALVIMLADVAASIKAENAQISAGQLGAIPAVPGQQLNAIFPAGMEAVFPYDTTPFVRISIGEVIKTLGEAVVLVFLVMYLFLQNFRATLIPTIASLWP